MAMELERGEMSKFHIFVLFGIVTSIIVGGCVRRYGFPPVTVLKDIPQWVMRYPTDDTGQWVYAVGYAGPGFYFKDTVENAKNAARIELAKAIRVEIKEEMFDVMVNENRMVGTKDYIVSVSKSVVDTVLKNSEIVEIWHDKYGIVGEKGSVYVLARTKHQNIKEEVNKYLK